MTQIGLLNAWLTATPLRGIPALACALAVVVFPTFIRSSMGMGEMWRDCCIPYYPFILVAAVLLGWKMASILAVVSAAITDYLFVGQPFGLLDSASAVFDIAMFLVSAFLIIGLVHLIRKVATGILRLTDFAEPTSGIIFSLEAGQAWASWSGAGTPLRLGPQEEVAEMMEDFLAQIEVAERLARTSPGFREFVE